MSDIERLNRTRADLAAKLARLSDANPNDKGPLIFLRCQISQVDRELLAAEVARLEREERYVFAGQTLAEKLGADAWILRAAPEEQNHE